MRDPFAPRRPWNAYAFFVSCNQELLKSQMPNKTQCERMRVSHLGSGGGGSRFGFSGKANRTLCCWFAVFQIMGQNWKSLPQEARQVWRAFLAPVLIVSKLLWGYWSGPNLRFWAHCYFIIVWCQIYKDLELKDKTRYASTHASFTPLNKQPTDRNGNILTCILNDSFQRFANERMRYEALKRANIQVCTHARVLTHTHTQARIT